MADMYFYEQAGIMALGSRLRRLAGLLTTDAESIYRLYSVDLDPRWFPVFYTLTLKEEAAITELAADIGQSHAAVSQVVRQMSKAGLVSASKSQSDSRKNLVTLTQHGWDTARRMEPQCRDVALAVTELLESVSADIWQNLQAIEDELDQSRLVERVKAIRKRREAGTVRIVPFTRAHASAFKALNLAWIRQHWEPEPADYQALDRPQANIINKGGYIAMAVSGKEAVGTCALIRLDDTTYELAKMAVADAAKGKGVGRMLGEAVIAKARELGAERVYLESNTILKPAIGLYRKLGFTRVSGPPSPYARCNIQMELRLNG